MKKTLKLNSFLQVNDLDGVLIHNPANIFYFSNFTGTNAILLITKENKYLLTDFRYIEQANHQTNNFEIIEIDENNTIEFIVNKLRRKYKLYKLGLEGDFISRNSWLNYERTLTSRLIDINLDHLRSIKEESEIGLIKKAIDIAEQAFLETLDIIKIGISEKAVARFLEYKMLELGADAIAFDTIVASGERGALPHGVASDKLLANNEFITIDYGCVYRGYCSDITRTIAIGEVDKNLLEIYEIVLKANKLGIKTIAAGIEGKVVDKTVRDFIATKGYGDNFGHGLGHSFGIEIHEEPRLNQKSNTLLEDGHIVTVEPGIYIPNLGGVRIEDDVLILNGKAMVLTSLNKELIKL